MEAITGCSYSEAEEKAKVVRKAYKESKRYIERVRKAMPPKPEPPRPTAFIIPEVLQLTIPLRSIEDIDYAISTLEYLKRRILEAQ